jgi:hypothetical protein
MLKLILLLLIALDVAAIVWILYSKTKGFATATRVSVNGYARFFSYETQWWVANYRKVVIGLLLLLAFLVAVRFYK